MTALRWDGLRCLRLNQNFAPPGPQLNPRKAHPSILDVILLLALVLPNKESQDRIAIMWRSNVGVALPGQTIGATLGASGIECYKVVLLAPLSENCPSIVNLTPNPFGTILCAPDKPFQLSSPNLPVIPLMANARPTPHQQDFVCHIASLPTSSWNLCSLLASFPRSHPQQMVPFQLISGNMQLSQTRMLLSKIATVQSAQGPEMQNIKWPRIGFQLYPPY